MQGKTGEHNQSSAATATSSSGFQLVTYWLNNAASKKISLTSKDPVAAPDISSIRIHLSVKYWLRIPLWSALCQFTYATCSDDQIYHDVNLNLFCGPIQWHVTRDVPPCLMKVPRRALQGSDIISSSPRSYLYPGNPVSLGLGFFTKIRVLIGCHPSSNFEDVHGTHQALGFTMYPASRNLIQFNWRISWSGGSSIVLLHSAVLYHWLTP